MSLRIGMGAGVGLFIGVIGLQSGGIIADHPSTLLTLEINNGRYSFGGTRFFTYYWAFNQEGAGAILFGVPTITAIARQPGVWIMKGVFSAPQQ